ncbi:MAG: RNA polymerase sigma factor [Myxococcales bacterium]|nr:RNA polymerase sigma factor [Myxococcales bacterium]MCB9736639.1 RNA polymerase sigma factor [Deltaproteobacteria bacterium]
MERFLEGRASAFQVLVNRYSQRIFNFILRHVGDASVAEDLVQDVFLRVVKNAAGFRAQAKFTTWLYTIARNLSIDALRKAKHRQHVALDKPLSSDDDGGATLLDMVSDNAPGSDVKTRDRRFVVALEKALRELPEEQREVFLMREMEGLKFREIADIIGVPENTVKSRMRYALEALRGHLAAFADTV